MATRPTLSIRAKLLAAYVVPTLVLFGAFGWSVDRLAKRDLESELAARLEAIAGAAAEQVRGENVIGFGPHDEDGELYGILQKKLDILKDRMGVDRIYVFDRERKSYLDSQPAVPVGEPYYQLAANATEIAAVLADGKPRSSVLFRGKDGRLYKSGYAAVRLSPDDPTIVAAIGVDANARFFDHLTQLRRYLVITGGVLLLLVVAASLLVGTVITRPLKRLSRAAERIGGGDLQTPVASPSRDEVGFLAATLEQMRVHVHARDERMQMMLAGIAHEVRNPLAGIELFAGLLREELEGDAAKQGHVAKIERELTHLKAVVSDFLEYARRPRPDLRPVEHRRDRGRRRGGGGGRRREGVREADRRAQRGRDGQRRPRAAAPRHPQPHEERRAGDPARRPRQDHGRARRRGGRGAHLRHRARDRRRLAEPHLHALLHDQGEGHRPRSRLRQGDRRGARRQARRRVTRGRRHHLHDQPARARPGPVGLTQQ